MDIDYRLITEAAEDILLVLNKDMGVEYINTFAASMLGGSPEMVIGMTLKELFDDETLKKMAYHFKKAVKSGRPVVAEEMVRFKDRVIWLNTKLIPVKETDGRIERVIAYSRDVTDRRNMEDELKRQRSELQERLKHAAALNELGIILMNTNDASKLIAIMTEGIGRALRADTAQIYKIDLEEKTGELLAEWDNLEKGGFGPSDQSFKVEDFENVVQEVWKNREPLISHFDLVNPMVVAAGSSEELHERYKIKTFLCFPFDFREHQFSILTLSMLKERRDLSEEELQMANSLTNQLTVAVMKTELIEKQEEAEKKLRVNIGRLETMLEGAVNALAVTAEKKDPFTAGHQHRVVELAVAIATEMGLDEEQLEGIRIAATVHDIGKIYIPAEILSKPAKLDELEFGLVQAHSQYGFDILETIEFPWPIAKIVLQHHERLDGSGYPLGTKGDDICQEAKILAVADVMEAMLSRRPYRPTLDVDQALKELEDGKGTLYDPAAVDACAKLLKSKGFTFKPI